MFVIPFKYKIYKSITFKIFFNLADPTCDDGLKNQDEEGVDCGGVCEACPTCYDGILNQNEENTDCGGECPLCRKF